MKKIGIIGAMELEVETLKAHMTTTKITTKAHMEFHEGTLNGTPVVIVRSGVGKVNAALCVQILADLFGVTAIINTGVAGSLNAALDIGDILISRDALHHDVDATIFGYNPGEVPQLGCREFIADEHLAQVAVSTCREVNPDIHVHTGRVVRRRRPLLLISATMPPSVSTWAMVRMALPLPPISTRTPPFLVLTGL